MSHKNLPLKHLFDLPNGIVYMDGNSLGPLPKAVPERVADMLRNEWGNKLITGWIKSEWMAQPSRIGLMLGKLIGAPDGSVVIGDTLSIKVYQALAAGLAMRPNRRVILSDTGNFPTDVYMADGLNKLLGNKYEIRLVDPDDIAKAITPEVAVVMLTQVDYRSGRIHDMEKTTQIAHDAGAVMQWDLAHSAGAIPVDLASCGAEFAVGCTYKYLNGGPGAPAFIYVRPDLIDQVEPALSGWLGHDKPFTFDLDYRPGQGIERMRVGTPPVIQMAALETALLVWDGLDMGDVRAACIRLSELFISEVERRCPELKLISPRDATIRGSQVAFSYEHGYAAMRALIDQGLIGDFRAPDVMRFGVTPLYLDESDIIKAAEIIENVVRNELWNKPEYQIVGDIT